MTVRYSEDLADKICQLLADDNSERAIEKMPGMPSRVTMRQWRIDNPDFLAKCARARLDQSHAIVEDMADIEKGVLKPANDADHVDPQAARVALSSKQWRAAKLNVAYSDRVHLQTEGSMAVAVTIQRLSDAQTGEGEPA